MNNETIRELETPLRSYLKIQLAPLRAKILNEISLFRLQELQKTFHTALKSMLETELSIPGLRYSPEYISIEEHSKLIQIIDAQAWMNDFKRRVQHYGYRYDYKKRSISSEMNLGPLPEWAQAFADKLKKDNLTEYTFNQVIVNEYYPGQGISEHIDCIPCFGKTIISLSLNSACTMEFINVESKEKKILLLEPRSLVIMSDEARYKWQHRIPARKKDLYQQKEFIRHRRVSLTFRQVIL